MFVEIVKMIKSESFHSIIILLYLDLIRGAIVITAGISNSHIFMSSNNTTLKTGTIKEGKVENI